MFTIGSTVLTFQEADVIRDRVVPYLSIRSAEGTRALAQAIADGNQELLEGCTREERATALFLAVTTLFTNEILNDPNFANETKPLYERLSVFKPQNWAAEGLRAAFDRQSFLFERILAPVVEEGLTTVRISDPLIDSPRLNLHPNSD